MKSLNYFIIFSSLSTILFGCGAGNSVKVASFKTDATFSAQRSIDSNERNIATRICYAYQSKSQNFRLPNFLNTKFNFDVSELDCKGVNKRNLVSSTLRINSQTWALSYETENYQNSNFMKNVQTDINGYLSNICNKIKNGQDISNTVDSGSVKVQITFFRDRLDGFFLQYFVNTIGKEYKIQSAEKFLVRTQVDMGAGKILGMDEAYSSQKVCQSGENLKFSNYEQTFTSH